MHLLNLPDELLLHVLSFLKEEDLTGPRLACAKTKALVDPLYFAKCEVGDGRQAVSLAESIALRFSKAVWLKDLSVSTRFEDDDLDRALRVIPRILTMTDNLRHLRLETPDCNSKPPELRTPWTSLQAEYEQVFAMSTVAVPAEQRLLPKLESYQMHFVDKTTSLYRLSIYPHVFLHPTLRSLTISCACTDWADALLTVLPQKYYRTTSLEYLHLEECDISPPALEVLLSFAKGLKHLIISEGVRYDRGFGMGTENARIHGSIVPEKLSAALVSSCAHSLQSISLDLGDATSDLQCWHQLDLTGLVHLETVAVSLSTAVQMLSFKNGCNHAIGRLLPYTVESLKIFGLSPYSLPPFRRRPCGIGPHMDCLVTDKARHGLPALREMCWSYQYKNLQSDRSHLHEIVRRFGNGDMMVLAMRQLESTRTYLLDACTRKIPQYRRAHVRVKIEVVDQQEVGYIPPFLSYEPRPIESILWDYDPQVDTKYRDNDHEIAPPSIVDPHSVGHVTQQATSSQTSLPEAQSVMEDDGDDLLDIQVVFPGLPQELHNVLDAML